MALGWPIERIHTIDSDLGVSEAHAEHRDSFQQLVSEVAPETPASCWDSEVSRLARNNADWHRLLALAALARTITAASSRSCTTRAVLAPSSTGDIAQYLRSR
jgi:DNA invertase Pin-like site-specific DNA recombinase